MCKVFEETRFLPQGWVCCKCNIYNGLQRNMCRNCSTPYCLMKSSFSKTLGSEGR